MQTNTPMSIVAHFSSLTDPRVEGRSDHKLLDIIVITVCAVISGANTWTAIEEYGKSKEDWLRTILELPTGIPSHDTFGRVFSLLSPDELERCFLSWVQSVFEITNGQIISIDGKTLRHSYDRSSKKSAIHMVSAWASKNRITLGQVKTDEKSNEITAIPELLELLDLEGCIVTIDAMGCQRKIVEKIVDDGGDYVLAVKGNQETLHEKIISYFQEAQTNDFEDISFDYHETLDGDHGRVEIRRHWISSDFEFPYEKKRWKGLVTIGAVESEQHVGDKVSLERRYYIASIEDDAKKFAEAVRKHWGIENSVHWILDVVFKEDDCRIRKGYAAENFSRIRRIALNLLRHEKTLKGGIETKRLKAAWEHKYLLKVLKV